jgi:hypothetical protein
LLHAVPVFGEGAYPLDTLESEIKQLIQVSQLVVIVDPELHRLHLVKWFKEFDSPNVCWLVGGILNFDLKSIGVGNVDQIVCSPRWIYYVTQLYKNKKLAELLSAVDPYAVRPKMFDILLGRVREHRSFVYETVNMNPKLADLSVMTYNPVKSDSYGDGFRDVSEFYGKDTFIWEPDCVPLPNLRFTWDQVVYNGVPTTLSHVAPLTIYNQTAYSIVAETTAENHYSFFTEKIAKPIVARRLFIVFSGQHYLRNLRRLGFATFDGVIDESYDSEPNDLIRWFMAAEQMKWLAEQPQAVIFEEIRGRVEHNFKYAMAQDWNRFARSAIDQWLEKIK